MNLKSDFWGYVKKIWNFFWRFRLSVLSVSFIVWIVFQMIYSLEHRVYVREKDPEEIKVNQPYGGRERTLSKTRFEFWGANTNNNFLEFWSIPSLDACKSSQAILNGKEIFSPVKENGEFKWCFPTITVVSNDTIEFPICVSAGAGSGECGALLMNYHMDTQKWSYAGFTYYSAATKQFSRSYFSSQDYKKKLFADLPYYVMYSFFGFFVGGDEGYDLLQYFADHNMLDGDDNIPWIIKGILLWDSFFSNK